jgi:hypothetical protein
VPPVATKASRDTFYASRASSLPCSLQLYRLLDAVTIDTRVNKLEVNSGCRGRFEFVIASQATQSLFTLILLYFLATLHPTQG